MVGVSVKDGVPVLSVSPASGVMAVVSGLAWVCCSVMTVTLPAEAVHHVDLVGDRVDRNGRGTGSDRDGGGGVAGAVDDRHAGTGVAAVGHVDLVGDRVDRNGRGIGSDRYVGSAVGGAVDDRDVPLTIPSPVFTT